MKKPRIAIEKEAEAVTGRVKQVATAPRPNYPHNTDNEAWKSAHHKNRAARRRLMLFGQHQARLAYTSAYDHLVTIGRVLGSDGRVSLYAHTTLSRSVCEAAVRLSWLLDASVGYETRLLRSAVALYGSELNRLKGVNEIPADHIPGQQRRR